MMMNDSDELNPRPISFSLILRLFKYLHPFKKYYFLVCFFGLLVAALEIIPPKLVGHTIDSIHHGLDMQEVGVIAAVWLVISITTQVLHGFQISIANRYGERVLSQFRVEIFEHIQCLPIRYFDRTHIGRIITRAWSDVEALRNILIWGVNTLVANTTIMTLAAIMIFSTSPKLFLAVFWLAPAMTLLNFFYGKKVGIAWQTVRRHSSRVQANQAENITGVRVVAAFNRQRQNLKYFNELQNTNTKNNVAASALSGRFQPTIQWVRFIGQAIILVYGGFQVSRGDLLPGNLIATSLYWEWFMQPAVNFGAFFNELLIALTSSERIFSLLDQVQKKHLASRKVELPTLKGKVRFDQVSFEYLPEIPVLKDVSFEVAPGSTVALVGATGSGKSTIISLLARFYEPKSGKIEIDDHELRSATSESFHQQLAMVLQTNYLFSGTVIDNLRYIRPGVTDAEIYRAAQELGCHERFLQLKDGYLTHVGGRGTSLSLGERQLICFTRAMLVNPKILLLDEATSALDPITELQIQNALAKLVANRTTFIVAHRLSTIIHADLILVLDQGKILEHGTHRELISKNGKYAQLHTHSHVHYKSNAEL